MDEELKACPRCGNRAFIPPFEHGWHVWCLTDMCLRLPPRATEAEAIAAWNARTPAVATDGEVVKVPHPSADVVAATKEAIEYHRARGASDDRIAYVAGRAAISATPLGEYREVLKRIGNDDVPRPVGKHWRNDAKPNKNDKCIHDHWMYEDCGECIAEFARAALGGHGDAGGE